MYSYYIIISTSFGKFKYFGLSFLTKRKINEKMPREGKDVPYNEQDRLQTLNKVTLEFTLPSF